MRVDADGVRIVQHGGARRVVTLGVAAIVLVVLVTAATMLLLDRVATVPPAPGTQPPPAPMAPAASMAPAVPPGVASPAPAAPRDVRPRRKRSERKAAAAAAAKDGEEIDARDVIPMLQAAGEREGIAAFPVPGTDPPKAGLVVPDDFVLPEGYVRHFQATDDGERLPPILMFHPDYDFVDASGNVVALPDDGVVPPELAPPGLPLDPLELPDRTP